MQICIVASPVSPFTGRLDPPTKVTSLITPYEDDCALVVRPTLNFVSTTSPYPTSAALEGWPQHSLLDPP
jgi:hypothetical protein